jgi:Abscisic acid G-protein coupled receptor
VWALILAEAVGTCFTASVLLLQNSMPAQHRAAITAAIGGSSSSTVNNGIDNTALDSSAAVYQSLFDWVFLVSAVGSGALLLALRRRAYVD